MNHKYHDPTARKVVDVLGDATFPCDRDDLVAAARDSHVDRDFLDSLQALPQMRFHNIEEVIKELIRV